MDVLSSRIILRAGDFDGSRAFYEQTLGLSIYREYGVGGVVTGVVYFLGGGFLELTYGDAASREGVVIWLQVPDVLAEERRLTAAGVTVRKAADRMPWGSSSSGSRIPTAPSYASCRCPTTTRSATAWSSPAAHRLTGMCRNITELRGLEPPATREEIDAAAWQFVRKVTGVTKPTGATHDDMHAVADEIAGLVEGLLDRIPARRQPPKTVPPLRRPEVRSAARARAAHR